MVECCRYFKGVVFQQHRNPGPVLEMVSIKNGIQTFDFQIQFENQSSIQMDVWDAFLEAIHKNGQKI